MIIDAAVTISDHLETRYGTQRVFGLQFMTSALAMIWIKGFLILILLGLDNLALINDFISLPVFDQTTTTTMKICSVILDVPENSLMSFVK